MLRDPRRCLVSSNGSDWFHVIGRVAVGAGLPIGFPGLVPGSLVLIFLCSSLFGFIGSAWHHRSRMRILRIFLRLPTRAFKEFFTNFYEFF